MADNRDRLVFKVPRIIEGEASGRFAITVFALLVVAVLVAVTAFGRPLAYRVGWAVVNGAEVVSTLWASIPGAKHDKG